jgi:mannose/fructose/N-acetylgalactosamine-specific phosphotransferase system component IIC
MYDKKLIPFFIIGFTGAAFLKLNLIAAALFGLGAALLYVQIFDNGNPSKSS